MVVSFGLIALVRSLTGPGKTAARPKVMRPLPAPAGVQPAAPARETQA